MDSISKEDLYKIGVKKLIEHLKEDNYTIIESYDNPFVCPTIVAEKNNETIAIDVEVDVYPKKQKLKEARKYAMIDYCRGYDIKPYYASITLASSNIDRKRRNIILNNESIVFEFVKLEPIDKKIPKTNTRDYYIYVMQSIASRLGLEKFDSLNEFFSEDIEISNNITHDKTKNVLLYLKYLSSFNIKSLDIIRFVGSVNHVQVKNLIIGDESKENVSLQILQEPNKINLLILFERELFKLESRSIILNFNYNDDGKINKIEVINPILYNFTHYDSISVNYQYPELLTDKLLSKITLDDVLAYSSSVSGAQGRGNEIEAFIKIGDDIQLYTGIHSNKKESKLTTNKVMKFFISNNIDDLKEIGWDWINLGLGNGLYVRSKYYESINNKYGELLEFPFVLYSTWKEYMKYLLDNEYNEYNNNNLLIEINEKIDEITKE